jgi:hypothetical protein
MQALAHIIIRLPLPPDLSYQHAHSEPWGIFAALQWLFIPDRPAAWWMSVPTG